MKYTPLIIAACSIIFANSDSLAAERVHAGAYLSGYVAQQNHDWTNASKFMGKIIKSGSTTNNILQRSMILSMGSGDAVNAVKIAKRIKLENPDSSNTITEIILIAEAFKNKNYKEAEKIFNNMPNDGTTRFISPFIKGWLDAAQGTLNISELRNNTVQLYHGILISDFLNDHSTIEKMIDKALKVEDINLEEIERIADLYGHVGIKNKAIDLYNKILESDPNNENIKSRIINLEQNTNEPLFENIKTSNQGIAKAFLDIANILYNEKNDDSSRIFAHISLYLAPDMTRTKFLLAAINKTHEQYDEAISYYNSVPASDHDYMDAQYKIVDIYEDTKNFDDALSLLNSLSAKYQDTDTLMKIGDLYRHQDDFKAALKSYDAALKKLGGTIPKDYWQLHYVRGISYEQLDNWTLAEKELKAALNFQPDHPYILNYLGYAWADKGINLEKSLTMIQRAVDIQPSDGYITDSLGWVMYRTKNYKNAVPVLEQAVKLLPYDPTINDHLGDAYWKVGRKLEAEFQWQRAKNNSKDDAQVQKIETKLISGLDK